MAVVNVGASITKALTKITGKIPRPTLVVWFNEIVDDILSQPREWRFLTEPLSLDIVNSQITLPVGVSEVISIQLGELFFTPANMLSDKEAAQPAVGYTLSPAGIITLYTAGAAGSISGTAKVTVEKDITTDYADDAETLFNTAFQGLFLCGLRKEAYYVDKDGRFTAEQAKYDQQMAEVKAWDNRLKPRPHFSHNGYVRSPE